MNRTESPKIDCVVRVITPENIEFEYMVAGPFQRLPAFLVDFVLRVSFFFGLVMTSLIVGIPLGRAGSGMLFTYAVGLLAFFVLSWLYGAVMEAQFNGRTIGKMLFGLRVISSDGRPINASQAALRNLLRLCDFMPPLSLTLLSPEAPPIDLIPTCFIGLVAMLLTDRLQRVGDLAAGTMVVWEGRRGFHTNLQPEDARVFSLAELIPPTFSVSRSLARVVALYMERRVYLSAPRREEVAGNLARPLLKLFGLQPDTSADLLLCAIYVRVYHSQQQREGRLAELQKKKAMRIDTQAPTRWLQPTATATNVATAGPPLVTATVAATATVPTATLPPEVIEAEIIEEPLPGSAATQAPRFGETRS